MSRWPRNLREQVLAGLVLQAAAFQIVAAVPMDEPISNAACIQCHETREPELVSAWRASAHGEGKSPADCVACHGDSHEDAAPRARRDEACTTCHGGAAVPVVHSYTTSKHGVLVRLEQQDWTQPLANANYRAPGCAYCHMYAGRHDVGVGVRLWKPLKETTVDERERIQDAMRVVCSDCHSPRYITRLFGNGERMLSIARMKVREASTLLERAAREFSVDELAPARAQMENMQHHLKNVLLGVGHQSPDYQWWHGQPALDGDLLRIKGIVTRLQNRSAARQDGHEIVQDLPLPTKK